MEQSPANIQKLVAAARIDERDPAKIKVMVEVNITHPAKDELMGVRVSDWLRLKHLLRRVETPLNNFAVWWACLFGVGATCVVGAIPLYVTPGVKTWVAHSVAGTAILTCFLGCIFLVLDRARSAKLKQDVSDIQREVGTIDAALEDRATLVASLE